MNIDTLIDYVVIKKTQTLTYDERMNIIKTILKLQEEFIKLEDGWEMTALGLQTLSDKTLVIILNDTYTLNATQFFVALEK